MFLFLFSKWHHKVEWESDLDLDGQHSKILWLTEFLSKWFHSLVFFHYTIGHKRKAFQATGSIILSNQRSLWHCMLYCHASWEQLHLSFMLSLHLDFWMFCVISKVHKIQFHKLCHHIFKKFFTKKEHQCLFVNEIFFL